MKDEGVICYTGMMTGIMMALTDRLVEDGIPWAMAARNASVFMWPVKPFFAYHTCDADVTVMFLEWFWENKLKRAHPVKIAAIYLDTPYGRAALDGGVREWIKDNPNIVDFPSNLDFPVPMTTTDLTPELTKIKAANVDLIVQEVLKPQVEPLFGGLIKQDITKPVFAMASQAGATFPEAIQKAPPGGQYSTETTPYTWEVDNPMIQSIKAMYDKITPPTEWELEWVEGWIVAELMREGISRALSNVGYDNLDAAAMYSTLETMKNFEPWPGGLPPISYSPTDHRGITMTRIYFTTGDKSPEYRMWPITEPLPTPTIIPPGVK